MDFLLKTGLVIPSEIAGATIEEIEQFEQEFQIKFPLSIKAYLLYFGKRFKMQSGWNGQKYTLDDFREAIELARNEDFFSTMSIFNGNIKDYLYFRIDDRNSDYIFFCDTLSENPAVYLQWNIMDRELYVECYGKDKKREISKRCCFTSLMREDAVQSISYEILTLRGLYEEEAHIQDVPWAMYHHQLLNKKRDDNQDYISIGDFYQMRRDFYPIIEAIEEKEDRILTIDEFEWAYIEHLKEKGYTV